MPVEQAMTPTMIPKTTALTSPEPKSPMVTKPSTPLTNSRGGTPYCSQPTTQAADGADGVGDDGHERHRDGHRDDARRHQPLHRIGAERAHGVELLGDRHAAELGGDAGADAAAGDERGQDRPELAHQRGHRRLPDVELGAEALEAVAELERQHHAGEDGHGDDEAERAHADRLHLVGDVAQAHRARGDAARGRADEQRDAPERAST